MGYAMCHAAILLVSCVVIVAAEANVEENNKNETLVGLNHKSGEVSTRVGGSRIDRDDKRAEVSSEDFDEGSKTRRTSTTSKPRKFTLAGRPKPTIATKKRYTTVTSKKKFAKLEMRNIPNIKKIYNRVNRSADRKKLNVVGRKDGKINATIDENVNKTSSLVTALFNKKISTTLKKNLKILELKQSDSASSKSKQDKSEARATDRKDENVDVLLDDKSTTSAPTSTTQRTTFPAKQDVATTTEKRNQTSTTKAAETTTAPHVTTPAVNVNKKETNTKTTTHSIRKTTVPVKRPNAVTTKKIEQTRVHNQDEGRTTKRIVNRGNDIADTPLQPLKATTQMPMPEDQEKTSESKKVARMIVGDYERDYTSEDARVSTFNNQAAETMMKNDNEVSQTINFSKLLNLLPGHHKEHTKTITVVKKVPEPYSVEKTVHIPVVKNVPYAVEVPVPEPFPIEKHIHYPVKVLVKVPVKIPKPFAVYKESYYPVHVPVDRMVPHRVYIPEPYPVEKRVYYEVKVPFPDPFPVERKVPVTVKYPEHILQPYPVDKIVPYPIKVEEERPVPVPIPKPIAIPVTKHIPYKIEKYVPYPIKVPVDNPVPVHYDKPVPVHVKVPEEIPYPVEKTVPYQTYQNHIAYPLHRNGDNQLEANDKKDTIVEHRVEKKDGPVEPAKVYEDVDE